MTSKTAIITVYIAFLCVFFVVVLFATFLDIIGICTYDDGIMQTCTLNGINVSALYNTNPIVSLFANTNLFFFWILLGGGTLYYLDWRKKKNA